MSITSLRNRISEEVERTIDLLDKASFVLERSSPGPGSRTKPEPEPEQRRRVVLPASVHLEASFKALEDAIQAFKQKAFAIVSADLAASSLDSVVRDFELVRRHFHLNMGSLLGETVDRIPDLSTIRLINDVDVLTEATERMKADLRSFDSELAAHAEAVAATEQSAKAIISKSVSHPDQCIVAAMEKCSALYNILRYEQVDSPNILMSIHQLAAAHSQLDALLGGGSETTDILQCGLVDASVAAVYDDYLESATLEAYHTAFVLALLAVESSVLVASLMCVVQTRPLHKIPGLSQSSLASLIHSKLCSIVNYILDAESNAFDATPQTLFAALERSLRVSLGISGYDATFSGTKLLDSYLSTEISELLRAVGIKKGTFGYQVLRISLWTRDYEARLLVSGCLSEVLDRSCTADGSGIGATTITALTLAQARNHLSCRIASIIRTAKLSRMSTRTSDLHTLFAELLRDAAAGPLDAEKASVFERLIPCDTRASASALSNPDAPTSGAGGLQSLAALFTALDLCSSQSTYFISFESPEALRASVTALGDFLALERDVISKDAEALERRLCMKSHPIAGKTTGTSTVGKLLLLVTNWHTALRVSDAMQIMSQVLWDGSSSTLPSLARPRDFLRIDCSSEAKDLSASFQRIEGLLSGQLSAPGSDDVLSAFLADTLKCQRVSESPLDADPLLLATHLRQMRDRLSKRLEDGSAHNWRDILQEVNTITQSFVTIPLLESQLTSAKARQFHSPESIHSLIHQAYTPSPRDARCSPDATAVHLEALSSINIDDDTNDSLADSLSPLPTRLGASTEAPSLTDEEILGLLTVRKLELHPFQCLREFAASLTEEASAAIADGAQAHRLAEERAQSARDDHLRACAKSAEKECCECVADVLSWLGTNGNAASFNAVESNICQARLAMLLGDLNGVSLAVGGKQ